MFFKPGRISGKAKTINYSMASFINGDKAS